MWDLWTFVDLALLLAESGFAVFVFVRLLFFHTEQINNIDPSVAALTVDPSPWSLGQCKRKLDCREWAEAALGSWLCGSADVSVWSSSFSHRAIKLYDVCIKCLRPEIHFWSAPYFPVSPPFFSLMHTYTFLSQRFSKTESRLLSWLQQIHAYFTAASSWILHKCTWTHVPQQSLTLIFRNRLLLQMTVAG